MSEKRKRGGQKNNLNAAKRPWRSFWKRRALRPEHRHINRVVEDGGSELLRDHPDASAAQRRCIEIWQIARGASMLILGECAASGFITKIDGTWDLSPGAKELARFLSIERACLQTLGLERKTRAPIMLSDYIEAKRKNDQEPQP